MLVDRTSDTRRTARTKAEYHGLGMARLSNWTAVA
jgi:hypothetical protein